MRLYLTPLGGGESKKLFAANLVSRLSAKNVEENTYNDQDERYRENHSISIWVLELLGKEHGSKNDANHEDED